MSACTCKGDRWPDGCLIVTVGCRVHHHMPDGCLAAEHEVRCETCGQFFCDHECAFYERVDEGEREEVLMCGECGPYCEANHGWFRS